MQDAALGDFNEKWFALMLRYQTTHDRAFHKCLTELRTLRQERRQAPKPVAAVTTAATAVQFESQNAKTAAAEPSSDRPCAAEELDRLSPEEISALVQASLKRANLTLDDFADEEEDEVRIVNA